MRAAAMGAIPNIAVPIELADPDGATLATMDVDYAFRPIGGQS